MLPVKFLIGVSLVGAGEGAIETFFRFLGVGTSAGFATSFSSVGRSARFLGVGFLVS